MDITNRISELKSTKSWKYLNSINKEFALITINFLEKIDPILDDIQTIFPFYTRHDSKHGYQVLKRIEEIVENKCYSKNHTLAFQPSDIFLLICASYAHDLGMSVFPDEKEILLLNLNIQDNEHWQKSPILQKYLRDHHSERGGKYINEHDEFKIPLNLVYPLHQLMSSHNWSIQQMEREFSMRTAADNKEIDLKQLACILCIADAIEFSDTRVIDGVLAQLEDKIDADSIMSYRENMKHFCIQNSVAVAHDGKIIFSGTFKDPEVLNLAHKTVDLIEDWVRKYCDIDYLSFKKRLRIRSDSISRNLKSLRFDFERLGIRIRKENIINLISSNSTWSNNTSVAIRELLQNSVEACRFRSFNTNDEGYTPEINISISKNDKTIIIDDNGCGMSRNVVLNNFLTVGNSRSSDATYKNKNYSPLARFGIGFWSVFVLANEVYVETTPFEPYERVGELPSSHIGLSFSVNINEFKDYTIFNKITKTSGTKIILKLKHDVNIDILVEGISHQLTYSDIPIAINYDDYKIKIPNQIQLIPIADILGPKANYLHLQHIKSYRWSQSTEKYDFLVEIYYTAETRLSFLLWGNTLNVSGRRGNLNSFSVCGFMVNIKESASVFSGNSVAVSCLNYKDPSGFSYSLNRNNLLENEMNYQVQEIIQDGFHDAYRNLLKKENR